MENEADVETIQNCSSTWSSYNNSTNFRVSVKAQEIAGYFSRELNQSVDGKMIDFYK
jgi:ferredoxin-NADP reductase